MPNDPRCVGRNSLKCEQLRKMYNDAGVNIHIHKIPFGQTDDDIDFNFQIAKALGCKAITTERNDQLAKRLAPFAEKHKIWVAFHNHTNNVPTIESIDPLMQIGDYIGFNFDIGHYVAGTNGKSPIPVIEKYHDKIISLHLKDRAAGGAQPPVGRGTDADQGSAATAEEGEVADLRGYRTGIQSPARLQLGSRSREVCPILQGSRSLEIGEYRGELRDASGGQYGISWFRASQTPGKMS